MKTIITGKNQKKIEIKKPKGLGWVYKYGSLRKPLE